MEAPQEGEDGLGEPRPTQSERLAPSTVNKAFDQLAKAGLLREITGGARNRLFAYDKVLAILNEG